ncbi:hypothetical protein Bca52824_024956 [Brassica carinata]|uniref:Uncharacterized protein n=1 Tax=Brassica carinata TaxID=52824 RepID=A0A8X7VLH3_BRACI|nr:hypothetical protein Bca52824_024956 [Brassica carinata]
MKIPTGRFGNGRVFSDIVAEGLGIKKTLPAARKLFIAPSDLKTGVCFASGGAGVDPVTSRLLQIYDQGARKFAVMGVIPFGCLPMTRVFGFSNANNGCCCMPTAIVPCINPHNHVFYDFVHPSEKAYKTISKRLVQDIKRGLA